MEKEKKIHYPQSILATYSDAVIVRKVDSILMFCVNQEDKDYNLNIVKFHL